MPSKHAKLSASSAFRWINCPGSVALADQLPAPGSSAYADEGTLAHALAELKLRKFLGDAGNYDKELAQIQASEYYCGEMDEATDFYAESGSGRRGRGAHDRAAVQSGQLGAGRLRDL